MASSTTDEQLVSARRNVAQLATQLTRSGQTLATAESCTGGLIGMLLTERPGSSAYYLGGVVSYANSAKTRLLGVTTATLTRHGAVSAATAEAMARGIRRRLGADVGLSVTGIAGPDGGTPDKPIGLVYLGVATAAGVGHRRLLLGGDRSAIRAAAAAASLALALEQFAG